MAELTKDEFWLISVYFEGRGFNQDHYIHDIEFEMMRLSFSETTQTIKSLVQKKVLSLSPDKYKVKFTDYGVELYQSMARSQKDWESQGVIKVSNLDRDQIIIRSGETFKANRVLREIISQVRKELCIIDPYMGPMLFDLIEDAGARIVVKIITSDRARKDTFSAYSAFKNQYPQVEMRILDHEKMHDRYILWDRAHGLHLGHSIKDLGKKDTQLNLLKDPSNQWELFEQRWKESRPISS